MHGLLTKEMVPPCDVLVIAGDYAPNFASRGEVDDARKQLEWVKNNFNPLLRSLDVQKVILCAGNHEWLHYVDEVKRTARHALEAVYLEDQAYEFEGVKFYASPYQSWFYDWAFNFNRLDPVSGYPEAKKIWSKIPDGVDVLITHGPPLNIRDQCRDGRRVGCPILRDRVLQIKPKLHVFGHIHGGYGAEDVEGIRFGNVSLCDEEYKPANPIQVFEI